MVTSRTQARDLLWTFDAVQRLSDAAEGGVKPTSSYIKPSVLWWAFNAASARKQALAAGVKSDGANADPTMDDSQPSC